MRLVGHGRHQILKDFLELLRVGASGFETALGPLDAGGRHHLHGLGDLLDVANRLDAALDFAYAAGPSYVASAGLNCFLKAAMASSGRFTLSSGRALVSLMDSPMSA